MSNKEKVCTTWVGWAFVLCEDFMEAASVLGDAHQHDSLTMCKAGMLKSRAPSATSFLPFRCHFLNFVVSLVWRVGQMQVAWVAAHS